MLRRHFLSLPAATCLSLPVSSPSPVIRLRLASAEPWLELERNWRFGTPSRIIARAPLDWWPNAVEAPNTWRAWVETESGAEVLVECPRRVAAPRPADRTANAIWLSLTSEVAAGV